MIAMSHESLTERAAVRSSPRASATVVYRSASRLGSIFPIAAKSHTVRSATHLSTSATTSFTGRAEPVPDCPSSVPTSANRDHFQRCAAPRAQLPQPPGDVLSLIRHVATFHRGTADVNSSSRRAEVERPWSLVTVSNYTDQVVSCRKGVTWHGDKRGSARHRTVQVGTCDTNVPVAIFDRT